MAYKVQKSPFDNSWVHFFLYFNFTNNVGHIWFSIQKKNGKIIYRETAISNHFVSLYKVCYLLRREHNVNKECNLLNLYLLTVLSTIPFNELPCLKDGLEAIQLNPLYCTMSCHLSSRRSKNKFFSSSKKHLYLAR